MKVPVSNMWVSLQGYARTAAKAMFDESDDPSDAVHSLADAGVFGVEALAALKRSPVFDGPAEERTYHLLHHFTTISCANNCLTAIFWPVACYLNHDGQLDNLNFAPLMPILKPAAAYYASVYRQYAAFASLSKKHVSDLLYTYVADTEPFGMGHSETCFAGLKTMRYAATLLRDESIFAQFSEQIVLPLIDKSIAITGTVTESAHVRDVFLSEIGGLKEKSKRRIFTESSVATPRVATSPSPRETPAFNPSAAVTSREDPVKVLESAKAELEGMIGLSGVKEEVRRLANFLTIQAERRRHGLRDSAQSLHFVFTGNPGTGKTTVARILGELF